MILPGSRRRVLVAMSGGVDSSVAAALLVEAGHEVVGATMKTFCYQETPGHSKTCCGLDGIMDARRVADRLGIAHHVFDVEEDFTRDVIDDFVSEYAEGRTPNPCVRCNSNTKFRDLLARGELLGCDAIATGHYVRSGIQETEGAVLRRGIDSDKDQAYFLWGLPRGLLPSLEFPLGEMTKSEVRDRARDLGLATAEKPESQEICFVPLGDYRQLLRERLPTQHAALEEGPVVDESGHVLGRHRGYAGFTVGQRRGLGGGFSEPMFVVEIRPETREVVVGPRASLFSPRLLAAEANWLGTEPPAPGMRVRAQIRHRAPAVGGRVFTVRENEASFEIHFDEPQMSVTPGQSVAVFDGDRLLGGGRIRRAPRGPEHGTAVG